jgi:hypothetical protein
VTESGTIVDEIESTNARKHSHLLTLTFRNGKKFVDTSERACSMCMKQSVVQETGLGIVAQRVCPPRVDASIVLMFYHQANFTLD